MTDLDPEGVVNPSAAAIWHAAQYSRFGDERLRPAVDLIARIPLGAEDVSAAADLGCGNGAPTRLLVASRKAR